MTAPHVSVILPTYNRAHLLPRAIASVLGQSFADFELIVVDDGSRDATAAVIESFRDPRVVYLPPDRNLGDAGARNRGVARARGEWLAFQDSDDEWFPGKLGAQVAHAAELGPEYAAVGSTVIRFVGGPTEQWSWPLRQPGAQGDVDPRGLLRGRFAYLQSLLVRRAAFEQLGGFDTRVRARSDYEFCLRLAQQSRIAALAEPMVISHETPDSISGRPEYQLSDLRYMLEHHGALIEQDRPTAASYHYDLAKVQTLMGHRGPAFAAACSAVARDPRQLRSWALLALLPFGAGAVDGISRVSQRLRARRR